MWNINGSKDDEYRYKAPVPTVKVGGRGNGIFTELTNIDDIASSISHPKEILCKFIASISGSNYINGKNSLTGTYSSQEIQSYLEIYTKGVVLCPVCSIPETVPSLDDKDLIFKCYSCKSNSMIKPVGKIDKALNLIEKYLKSGKEWNVKKGNMVVEKVVENQFDNLDFNPFD
jgi:translation initiation factor 5